jgi:hypothetical protein
MVSTPTVDPSLAAAFNQKQPEVRGQRLRAWHIFCSGSDRVGTSDRDQQLQYDGSVAHRSCDRYKC